MARTRNVKVLLIFDTPFPVPVNHDFHQLFKEESWESELSVFKTLTNLDYEVRCFGIHDDVRPLLAEIQANPPDVVFNLCEAVSNNREFESHLVALLELLSIKYTGASSLGLRICKDKGLTKKILNFHRVKVPKFLVSKKSRPLKTLKHFTFPAIIKPLELEGSEGITQTSLALNEKDALDRIAFLHERFSPNVIVEEFIEGREINVSVIGNEKLTLFPPRELFFNEIPDGEPKFATYKAKWDAKYRKRWGIKSGFARNLTPDQEKRLLEISKKIYKVFQIRGYARLDFRLSKDGEFYFIESNPNPSISEDEDFAQSAKKSGLSYDQLLDRIISLSGV